MKVTKPTSNEISNMLNTNFIENILKLQDINVNKIENTEKEKIIHCTMKLKPHECPNCGEMTTAVHDYREQRIKDIPAFEKNVIICLKKRRYRCNCGKRFQEENPFLPKYHRMTNRLDMLYASSTLSLAHALKKEFLKILDCENRDEAKKSMSDWINLAYQIGIPKFEKCAQTLINRSKGNLNSFTTNFTNDFTEGCNNKIKVLKRAYGYRNFRRLRNRILHMFSIKNKK